MLILALCVLLVVTRGQWISLLAPSRPIIEANAGLIQAIYSIINIVLVILNLLFIYITWFLRKPDEGEKASISRDPLTKITADHLLEQLGQYGSKVPFIDRNAVSISSLRQHGRIVISGQMKIGKSREAIELIKKAIANDLIPHDRIFQLSTSYKFYNPETLTNLIERSINIQDSILLFIDDFPRFFFKDSLRSIEALIAVLSKGKDFYIIITARDDDITDEHHEWFELHGFASSKLQPFSRKQMADFLDGASRALEITIEPDARDILINQSFGYPEYILIGLRKVLADGDSQVDKSLALQVTYQSLFDGWLSTKRYIEERKPAAKYIIRSLGFFRAALVTPYPNMVLPFAIFIWKNEKKVRRPFLAQKQLTDALNFLESFDFGVKAGIFLFPDIAIEGDVTFERARDTLGEFLVNYRSLLQKKGFRLFHRSSKEHSQCLLDLAYIVQNRSELDIAIRFYTASLGISPSPIANLNRGSAYGELGKISNALADFAIAEMLLKNDPLIVSVFYNRSVAYIEEGDFESALQNIKIGISIAPNYLSFYRNRGTVYSQQGKFDEALKDFDVVIKGVPIGYEKAHTYFARGNTYRAMGDDIKALEDYNKAIGLLPNNPRKASFYRARGNVHKDLGDDRLAIDDYSKAIILDANNAHAYFSRGYVYYDQKKYKEALNDFQFATHLDSKMAMAYVGKSKLYSELGNFPKAEQEINIALDLFDTRESKAMALVLRGDIFDMAGESKKALGDYSRAIDMLPDYAHAYFKRAIIHEKFGEFEQVVSDCTIALEYELISENQLPLLNTRGSAYDELEKYDLALEDFKNAISIDGENDYTHMNIGITLTKYGAYEEALASLSRAIKFNPQLWEAYANRGRVYSEIGKHKKALKDHNKAIQNMVDEQAKAGVFYNRGNTYMFLDRYRDAINDFTNAIHLLRSNSMKASSYYRRAICYGQQGDETKALEDLNNAISLDPNHSFALLLRGGLFAQNGSSKEAKSDYDQAVAIASSKKEQIEAHRSRGIHYSESGNYQQGNNDFDKTISLDPTNPVHYFNRGTNYLMLGDYGRAIIDFNRCLELNFEYAEAYNNRGTVYGSLGQHGNAIKDFDQAILYFGNKKEKVTAYRKKSISLAYIGQMEEAKICIQTAEKIAPDDELTLATKVQLEYIFGNYEETLELINKAEKVSAFPDQYGFWKTLVLFRLNQSKDAITSLRNFLKIGLIPVNYEVMKSELKEISELENPPLEISTAIKLLDDYIKSFSSNSF